jgi:hypothetical protein
MSACVGVRAYACAHARMVLLIQREIRMRHIVLLFVDSLAPPHFSTLSHKRLDFRKNAIESKMCFFFYFLYTFYLKIYHSKKNSAKYCLKCENVFSSDFTATLIFSII